MLTPIILHMEQMLSMSPKSKTKFQMQTTKPKFGLTTYLNICPAPWKEFGQQSPMPSRLTNPRCEEDKNQNTSSQAQYWTWPRKLVATPPSLSLSHYHSLATLSGTGSQGNLEKRREAQFIPGGNNSEPKM